MILRNIIPKLRRFDIFLGDGVKACTVGVPEKLPNNLFHVMENHTRCSVEEPDRSRISP